MDDEAKDKNEGGGEQDETVRTVESTAAAKEAGGTGEGEIVRVNVSPNCLPGKRFCTKPQPSASAAIA
jgi:hypothetical protein